MSAGEFVVVVVLAAVPLALLGAVVWLMVDHHYRVAPMWRERERWAAMADRMAQVTAAIELMSEVIRASSERMRQLAETFREFAEPGDRR